MKTQNFEKYLEKVCFEANPSVLDDDMPDFFNSWLSSQEGEDYIRLADQYVALALKEQREEIIEKIRVPKDEIVNVMELAIRNNIIQNISRSDVR